MNAIYSVKRFCKVLREWYITWRIWQKEVLLCSLSEKCSLNLLISLSTILEPVFHRDFVSRLYGKYPDIKPKTKALNGLKTCGNKSKTKPSECKVEELCRKKTETLSQTQLTEKLGTSSNKVPLDIVTESVRKDEPKSMGREIEILIEQVETNTYSESDSVVGEKVEEIQNQSTTCNNVSYLTDLIKDSLLKSDYKSQHITPETEVSASASKPNTSHKSTEQIPFKNSGDIHECRSNHVHTANIYNKDTGSRFFSASRFKQLSDMKADLSHNVKSEQGPCVRVLDQKCYKHQRWWSADPKKKQLISAQGLNLWKHYNGQLKEINERMDSWGDHERVNVISEVIKSSDPQQINFFAQCLIQRLKDNTDVSILPDQTLLKVFSKLDAKTLCQISQVSRRWKYLAEDGGLWKIKCLELGLSNGVNNLIVLIEKSADNHTVDWKQAYQEVYKLFQQSKSGKTIKEQQDEELQDKSHILVPVKSTSTISEAQRSQDMSSENDHISDHRMTSTATITADIRVELLDLSPATAEIENDGSLLSESEDVDKENDELIGGSLDMLEETLSELVGRKQEENNDEIAYDIRPNKLQPFNEMEDFEKEDQQLVTVGVEDVKSVKRVRKLQGHMDGVYTVQFDAKRCLTGSADRLLQMWDVRSGRAIRTMTGHLGGVRCAQFDDEKILSGSWDTTIMIWDIVKFTCIGILHGHQGCVSCLRFNSKHLVSGSHDMTVRVWKVDTWECLHVLEGHTDEVTCLFLGGRFLLTGSTDKTVKLWNVETGECMRTLMGHKSSVLSVQACRALVISGSEEGKIMFWDLEQGLPVAIIQAHDGPCNCIYVWGNHFLSGGGDHLVKQWDISTMTCLRTLQGHRGPVQCVKMSWSKIISSSEDGTVRIWDLEAPIHKLDRQYDEFENLLLPFTTLEHDGNEV